MPLSQAVPSFSEGTPVVQRRGGHLEAWFTTTVTEPVHIPCSRSTPRRQKNSRSDDGERCCPTEAPGQGHACLTLVTNLGGQKDPPNWGRQEPIDTFSIKKKGRFITVKSQASLKGS